MKNYNFDMWQNKEKYILSKAYPDDFKMLIDNCDSLDSKSYCAIKSILRIARSKKYIDVSYFFNKYKGLLNSFNILIKKLKKDDLYCNALIKFVETVNDKNYRKSCDYADVALAEAKQIDSLFFQQKNKKTSYFLNDYYKICLSSHFRRLQDKTQLFVDEKFDFPRKRLTHSIEVSFLAERIAAQSGIENYLYKHKNGIDLFFDRSDCAAIARCSGVLHDIGNPPFGHKGERVISSFFKKECVKEKLQKNGFDCNSKEYFDIACFDGNAQSLRIATKLMSFGNNEGASLTSGVAASIIKYPRCSDGVSNKIGYFLTEKNLVEDLKHFGVYEDGYRNPFSCILELADDISYLISDLEDGLHKKELDISDFENLFSKENDRYSNEFLSKIKSRYYSMENKKNDDSLEIIIRPLLSKFKENLIKSLTTAKINDVSIFEYIIKDGVDEHFKPIKYTEYNKLFECLERVKNNLIKKSTLIYKNENMAENVLNYLLEEYFNAIIESEIDWENKRFYSSNHFYNNLLSERLSYSFVSCFFDDFPIEKHNDNNEIVYRKMRMLIDHISGMTDSFAKYDKKQIEKMHKKRPSH